jgi:hypothetical protein
MVARRVKFQLATGKPLSYEFLSDEITPLDKINVLTSCSTTSAPDPSPLDPLRAERLLRPNPTTARPKGSPISVRFPIARGVSVLVRVDVKSKMNIVQALEAALAKARTRSELEVPPKAVEAMPDARTKTGPKPLTKEVTGESEIADLRKKLKDLAEAILVKNAVGASWIKKRYRSWLRRLSDVHGRPSNFAPLILELESNVFDKSQCRGPWKARRRSWRDECPRAKTFSGLASLVAEFEEWFQRG